MNTRKQMVPSIRTVFPGANVNDTTSATVVVEGSGPGLFPRSWPNFAHFLRSATWWSTTDFWRVRFVRRVIYQRRDGQSRVPFIWSGPRTFTRFPSSFVVYSITVRIPFSSM